MSDRRPTERKTMTTETSCPYCDSSVYVRLDRDLLAGGEPFRFHGEWSPDEPEAWETFTLQVHGKEAADVADITVDDLVKIVRRGVESGTIEGEVEDYCVEHNCGFHPGDPDRKRCPIWSWEFAYRPKPVPCDIVQRLVIPVPDSGEADDGA